MSTPTNCPSCGHQLCADNEKPVFDRGLSASQNPEDAIKLLNLYEIEVTA